MQLPPDKPWYLQPYTWQLAVAILATVACVVIMVLGLADVNGWHRAKGKVHLTENEVQVSFRTVDGQLVENARLNEPNTGWKEGQIIRIRYRIEGDVVAQTYSGTIVLGVCLAVAGLVIAALGISQLKDEQKRKKRMQHVQEAGRPVEAMVLSVFPDYMGLRKRDRTRYSRLDCAHYPTVKHPQQESGQDAMWIFTSERFLTPSNKFKGKVTVWVVEDNHDDYYVDLTTLQVEEVDDDYSEPPII